MNEKTIETKIDELTQVVSTLSQTVEKGFAEVHKEIGSVRTDLTKEIEGLAQMTAQGFTELGVRVETLENDCANKKDIIQLRGDVDVMLDKHIGEFRKDYDALAVRVKDLELA